MTTPTAPIPSNEQEALQWLTTILDQPAKPLADIAFKQAWAAVFYLYGGLHPDGALEHGTKIIAVNDAPDRFVSIDSRLVAPYYEESGWPVALVPLAQEAWRRYELGLLHDDDMYCAEAQHAGFMERMAG